MRRGRRRSPSISRVSSARTSLRGRGRASANDNGAKNAYTDFKRKIVAAASVPSMPATPPIPAPVSIVPASPEGEHLLDVRTQLEQRVPKNVKQGYVNMNMGKKAFSSHLFSPGFPEITLLSYLTLPTHLRQTNILSCFRVRNVVNARSGGQRSPSISRSCGRPADPLSDGVSVLQLSYCSFSSSFSSFSFHIMFKYLRHRRRWAK